MGCCFRQSFYFLPGVEPVQVQETVENHLKSLLIKHFDPRKADSIFTEEGEVRNAVLAPARHSVCQLPLCTLRSEVLVWEVPVLRPGALIASPKDRGQVGLRAARRPPRRKH